MHNDVMSAATDMQWIQQQIMYQVDAVVENLATNNPAKLLQHSQFIVSSIVGRIDVAHALDYCAYLQDTGELPCGKDRIACLIEYFVQCIELELATRYA